jgi:hypothetical protein
MAAFSLGTAAIFDLTGAVIYRIMRSGLPASPPAAPAGAAFQESAAIIRAAQREAINRARGRSGAAPLA